jgi:Ca-activated chloride channel family protein
MGGGMGEGKPGGVPVVRDKDGKGVRITALPMFGQLGEVTTFDNSKSDGEKGDAAGEAEVAQRRAAPTDGFTPGTSGYDAPRDRSGGGYGGRAKGLADSLGHVESSRSSTVPAGEPVTYPDPAKWKELTQGRIKLHAPQQQASEKSAVDVADLDMTEQLSDLDVHAPERAEDDLKIRYARAAADVAHAEYLKMLEANRKVKGAVPEVEINRLKLTWHKTKLEVARAEVEFAEARRAAEVDREHPLNDHAAEAYEPVTDNPFLPVAENPLSTFSIDVDTASYSIVRRYLQQNHQLPPPSAVRIEELVNYFHYDYPQPEGDKPFAANVEVAGCPWNAEHRLVRVGIKGREVARDRRPLTNLVFLVDVSGSMQSPDKLPLVKESLRLLTEQMGENDRVAIVVYAGSSGLVLPSTSGSDKPAILKSLDSLAAGGSTNGGQGIQLAYDIAVANFVKGGVNRVILATDGDFNVGVTDRGDLIKLIEQKAASGVFLTTLGYGMGNLKDATLEQLADKGNGNYAYIDNIGEAKKVLVEQMSGTLVTIAKDVKIQIEFNPTQVAAFRLIGYENRILRHEDFNDDKKDAGEIGAGHTVTALYELVPAGKAPAAAADPAVDPLKYQQKLAPTDAARTAEIMTLKLRYKQPDGDKSQLLEYPVKDSAQPYARATGDFKFAASVALFGMLLRDSPYKGTASFAAAHELAQEGRGSDAEGYRAEFIDLITAAKALRPGAEKQ